MRFAYFGVALMLTSLTSMARAADDPVPSPLIDALAKCLTIGTDAERLACTDVAARKLVEATRRREVVLVDQDEVKKTRKSLFGFALPRIGLFGKGGPDSGEDVERVEAPISRVAEIGYGKLTFTLADGARWSTTEPWGPYPPAAGTMLVIKRGAFGGYMVSVKGSRAVRAMRVG